MDKPGIVADDFRQMGQERDDIVLRLALDGVDALHVEGRRVAPLPDRRRRFLRNHAQFGERVAGMGLDLEPDAELGFLRPDGRHVGAGIAGDHRFRSREGWLATA